VYSRTNRKARVLFALADIALTAIAFEAAYQLRMVLPLERNFFLSIPHKALLLVAALLTVVLAALWFGQYDRLDTARRRIILRDALQQTALVVLALVLTDYLFNIDLSRTFTLLFAAAEVLVLGCFRLNARKFRGLIRREFGGPHYVLVVGHGPRALALGRRIEALAEEGQRLLGFVSDAGESGQVSLTKPYPLHPLAHLPELLRRHVIDEVLFAVESDRLKELEETLLLCDEEGVRTRISVDFFPHVNSELYLDRLGSLPMLTFSATPHDEVRLLLKRVVDVVVAGLALIVLSPLLAVTALLVKLSSKGPVIFRQQRCGLNGRQFQVLKFRSMVANAEELKEGLRHLNEKTTQFKIRNDPRLTTIGRWMRKFSVDELPQLWNVLMGDMSLVGPRPAVPEEVAVYERWQRRRLRMRPGLTCLWALNGRDLLDFESCMRMDMEYIDNWSLSLDTRILLRTVPQVLLGRGAS
jgi:exopolysaccharide biosynthesis polyprenyl glycosylphosphotransferase